MNEKKKRLPTLDDAQAAFAKIPKQLILAFVAACVFFAVFHAGFFDDRMVNEDYRHLIFTDVQRYAAGRFIDFSLVSDYCNSWMIGCVTCLYFALCVSLMVDMFHMKTRIGIILAAALMIGMPSLAYMFTFLSTAYVCGRAFFMAVFSVWIADRWRLGFLPGAAVLAISLGVTQGALIPAVVLCVLVLLRDLVFHEEFSYRALIKKLLKLMVMGIVGVILYFVMWRVVREIRGVAISDYRGMNQIGQFTIKQLISAIIQSYRDFIGFFFGSRFFYVSSLQKTVYSFFLFSCFLSIVYVATVHPARIPGIILAILLLPPCLSCVPILVPEYELDTMSIYSLVFVFVFSICLSESKMPHNRFGIVMSWVLVGSLFVTCFSYYGNTSALYVKNEAFNEQTAAYENRLLFRIESTPGYYAGIPVAIVDNTTNDYRGLSESAFPKVINDRDLWYSYVGTYTNVMKKTIDLIRAYTGVILSKASDAQIQQVRFSPEFFQMSAYPLDGSIKVINGILLVNMVSREVVIQQVSDNTVLLNYIDHTFAKDSQYAWYVYKNRERVSELERGYRDVPEHMVTFTEDGTYTFRGFCSSGNDKKSVNSSFAVVVKDGIIVADSRMERISLEEAASRVLPPVQLSAMMVGDRTVNLTIIENSILARGNDYEFAWRVYRDGEHAEKYDRAFAQDPSYDLNLTEDGTYRFELIYRKGNTGSETSVLSEEIGIVHEIDILQAGKNTVLLKYVGPAAAESNISYAWYVYKGKEVVDNKGRDYQSNSEHLVTLEEDGVYTFKCFCLIGKEKRSMLSFPVTMKDGAIVDDPRLGEISMEEAVNRARPEVEVQVTLVGERAVKLTMIDNTLNAGPEYAYAWYVYRNGERLAEYERGYYSDPEYDLILAEDGEYQFKLFYRIGKTSYAVMSESITIGEAQSSENAA